MEFLDLFTLKDVFIAGTGLIIASIIRIYYDSHVETKKVKRFGSSLGIYNSAIETNKSGLIVLSSSDEVIFVNTEAVNVLGANIEQLRNGHLDSLLIENEESKKSDSFLNTIHSLNHLPYAQLINKSQKVPVDVSINKINTSVQSKDFLYVINISDNSSINQLQDEARELLVA